jgi:hypothetical protein
MGTMAKGILLASLALLIGRQDAAAQRTQERKGFWFGFGAGYGSLGCDDCDGREGSGTGYLRLGGTVSSKVLIGFEANSWVKRENDATLSVSNGSAVIYFYPKATGGFHLKGGLGLATVRFDVDLGPGTFSVDDTGPGGLLGLGYDVRVGRNISLVPFANFLGGSFSENGEKSTFNYFQLGLGLTVH